MRDAGMITFLRQEINVYQFALAQLEQLNGTRVALADPLGYGRAKDMLSPLASGNRSKGSAVSANNSDVLRIGVFGGLGDVLCVTPALQALKKARPQRELHLQLNAEPHLAIFKNNPDIDHISVLKRGNNKNQKKLDIEVSVGFLGTDIHYREHAAFLLAAALGVSIDSEIPRYFIGESEQAAAQQALKGIGSLVVISPTSRAPANQNWPLQRWQSLMALFPDVTFAQVGLPDEEVIEGALDWRTAQDVRSSVAKLAVAGAYVGMDTFWAHAAAAVSTPAVVFFGGTHPSVFGYPGHAKLYKHLRCSPCHHTLAGRHCPYNTECINDITVDEAAQALREQLAV